MPQTVSETSLVTNACPIQLGNSDIVLQDELGNSDIVLQDEFGNSDLLEDGYSCTNRELVNLENAAVNIDNSNDVIIGPVTQFNVSGNITIYQNGQSVHEAINGTTISEEQQNNFKSISDAKLSKFEKSESEDQELKNLSKHKKFIKIISAISFVLLILIGITVMLIRYYNAFEENAEYTPTPGDDDNTYLGSHQVLDRTKWNGRPPIRYRNITSPVPLVIMKHTGGGMCYSFQECAGKMQTIQSMCVNKGAEDIYYNFLIGADGNIYVGRGWDVQPHQRDDVIDIAFMGSFVFDKLTPTMIEAAKLLIVDGAEKNKLTKDYKIVCHNQTEPTESPGTNVIDEVRKWPHYDPGNYFTHNLMPRKRLFHWTIL